MRDSNIFSQLVGNPTKAGHDTTVLQAPLTPIPKTTVVVVQSLSCPTLCNAMDCSTPGLHDPHHLSEFTQVPVH